MLLILSYMSVGAMVVIVAAFIIAAFRKEDNSEFTDFRNQQINILNEQSRLMRIRIEDEKRLVNAVEALTTHIINKKENV